VAYIVSSLPDMGDVNMGLTDYCAWLKQVVSLCVQKISLRAHMILCQTDRMVARQWLDKTTIINQAAADAGAVLRWHKIVLRSKWRTVELQNPTYSHMLCFSVEMGPRQKDTPDVVVGGPIVGSYAYSTPVFAVQFMLQFLQRWGDSSIQQVIDPFVGRSTTLAMAEKYGFSSVGVDNNREQCDYARSLMVQDVEEYLSCKTTQ
jgi:hypothetical protein